MSELREAILPALKQDMQSDPESWLSSKSNMLLAVVVLSIGKLQGFFSVHYFNLA